MQIDHRIEAFKLAEKIAAIAWGNVPHAMPYVEMVQELAERIALYFETGDWENRDG